MAMPPDDDRLDALEDEVDELWEIVEELEDRAKREDWLWRLIRRVGSAAAIVLTVGATVTIAVIAVLNYLAE